MISVRFLWFFLQKWRGTAVDAFCRYEINCWLSSCTWMHRCVLRGSSIYTEYHGCQTDCSYSVETFVCDLYMWLKRVSHYFFQVQRAVYNHEYITALYWVAAVINRYGRAHALWILNTKISISRTILFHIIIFNNHFKIQWPFQNNI